MNTQNTNVSFMSLLRLCLCLTLGITSLQAHATDPYHEHLADLYLVESQQARNHPALIKYTDPKDGKLLQSALQPNRVSATLNTYAEQVKNGTVTPDVTQIFRPILSRYETAFNNQPKVYEAEYLDCLEASALMVELSQSMLKRTETTPAIAAKSGKNEAENKQLNESLQKLNATVRELSKSLSKALADSIRKKVEQKMFSPAGTQRALQIADKLSAP